MTYLINKELHIVTIVVIWKTNDINPYIYIYIIVNVHYVISHGRVGSFVLLFIIYSMLLFPWQYNDHVTPVGDWPFCSCLQVPRAALGSSSFLSFSLLLSPLARIAKIAATTSDKSIRNNSDPVGHAAVLLLGTIEQFEERGEQFKDEICDAKNVEARCV